MCLLLSSALKFGPDYSTAKKRLDRVVPSWSGTTFLRPRDGPRRRLHTPPPLMWDRGPRVLSGEVVRLLPRKPQAHAGQINNPHHASPQVIQTCAGSRAGRSFFFFLGGDLQENSILSWMLSVHRATEWKR